MQGNNKTIQAVTMDFKKIILLPKINPDKSQWLALFDSMSVLVYISAP